MYCYALCFATLVGFSVPFSAPFSAGSMLLGKQGFQSSRGGAGSTHSTTLLAVASAKKKFVVVGAGWGGWGACQRLCEAFNDTAEVLLIDALPDPTGGEMRTEGRIRI